MNCPRCGNITVPGAAFCGECGLKLTPPQGNSLQDMLKRGEREVDKAARSAGDGLESLINEILGAFK